MRKYKIFVLTADGFRDYETDSRSLKKAIDNYGIRLEGSRVEVWSHGLNTVYACATFTDGKFIKHDPHIWIA